MWRTISALVVSIGLTACGTASKPSATTTTMPVTGGQQVVIAEPSGSPRGHVRHQLAGRITDIERAEMFYGNVIGLRKLYRFGDLSFFDCAGVRLLLVMQEAPKGYVPPAA